MFSKLRSQLTYANVVSTVCLFVVLGGTSYAVATGSIDSREIKNNTVRSKDVRNGTLRTSDVADLSLLAQDFAPGQLPKGEAGAKGDPGSPGVNGATNVTVRESAGTAVNAGATTLFVTKICNQGERATGGGAKLDSPSPEDRLVLSVPTDQFGNASSDGQIPRGWGARVFNGGAQADTARTSVVCAAP